MFAGKGDAAMRRLQLCLNCRQPAGPPPGEIPPRTGVCRPRPRRPGGDPPRQRRARRHQLPAHRLFQFGVGVALLLGLLIDASRRIRGDEAERSRLTAIGAEAFGHDGE